MPGPVSDSYDPEFGTGEHCGNVRVSLDAIDGRLTRHLGSKLFNIVEVAESAPGRLKGPRLSFGPRDLRLIRFAVRRAMESI